MIPVIMAGGSGARLWPESRALHPVSFCRPRDASLFALTLTALEGLHPPVILTPPALKPLVEAELAGAGVTNATVLAENASGTVAGIAAACARLLESGRGDQVLAFLPADQVVRDPIAFRRALTEAAEFAAKGEIVTLGVRETETPLGYVRLDAAGDLTRVRRGRFETSAPDGERAALVGYVIAKASVLRDQIERFAADAADGESFERAVLARLPHHLCLSLDQVASASWDWVVAESAPHANAVEIEARRNVVRGPAEKAYALVGVEDLVVVDTPDALLVARRGAGAAVGKAVETLRARELPVTERHAFDRRPWGTYEVLRDTAQFKSKHIVVNPGAQLSYQSHAHRAEHWIITEGSGEVVLDERVVPVKAGSHVFIPVGAKHRMRNTGAEPLCFVEVQLGTYFGEDDIVRYEDDYQRT